MCTSNRRAQAAVNRLLSWSNKRRKVLPRSRNGEPLRHEPT